MDNRGTTETSIVVSVPPSLGIVDGIERQDPGPMRISVLAVVAMVIQMGIRGVAGVVLLLPFAFLSFLAFLASEWIGVFILSCVAVSFDCLFLYIPIIDQENKCLDTDKTLRNVALILRSLTDIAFIFHIGALINGSMGEGRKRVQRNLERVSSIHTIVNSLAILPNPQVRGGRKRVQRNLERVPDITKKTAFIHTIVNFLAILPNPQVAIVVGSFRLGIIIVLLVFQYLLRIFQMFLSIKKVGGGKLVRGSFYFLLYIIASCVFAAFWYFFSIQRETSCWDQACQTIAGCMPIYDCGHSTLLNSTFLNNLCLIESPNATLFDFGMFRDILKSGITGSTNFPTKFFYTFWWGLKNLSNRYILYYLVLNAFLSSLFSNYSNFGTNLETSSYIWENCFAILICVIGLLLFIFLIGNVQTYIQSESEKFVKIRELRRTKIDTKYRDIEKWLSSHDIPGDMRSAVRKNIEEDCLVERIDADVDADFMYNCTSGCDVKSNPLIFVCVKALKKIPILRKLDEQALEAAVVSVIECRCQFQIHIEGSCIIQARKKLDSMYLIIAGEIECKDAERTSTQIMRRYDCCGEEVLRWAMLNYKRSRSDRDPFPISTVNVRCQTKTEAFKFTADDLIEILEKFNSDEALAPDSSTDQRIQVWLLRNGFPEDLKENIMDFVDKNNRLMEENTYAEVDVKFLFGILPNDITSSIKLHLGMNALRKVPMLRKMHDYVLEIICNHLKPVVYKVGTPVVSAGEPLGFMIFILRGEIIMTNETSSNATTTRYSAISESCDDKILRVGDFYGEQLLSWASPNRESLSDNAVVSSRNVKCETEVEALILKAEHLRSAVSKCGSQWNSSTSRNNEQTIQLHQGHDMLLEQLIQIRETVLEQLILIRETVFQLRNDISTQGGRLDEMATFLAKLGYTGTSSPPPAPLSM